MTRVVESSKEADRQPDKMTARMATQILVLLRDSPSLARLVWYFEVMRKSGEIAEMVAKENCSPGSSTTQCVDSRSSDDVSNFISSPYLHHPGSRASSTSLDPLSGLLIITGMRGMLVSVASGLHVFWSLAALVNRPDHWQSAYSDLCRLSGDMVLIATARTSQWTRQHSC